MHSSLDGSKNSDLEEYKKLKNQCDLPLKLKIYFSILDNAMQNPQSKYQKIFDNKKGFSKALLDAFNNFSLLQKGRFLLSTLNFVLQQQDRLQKDKTKSDSTIEVDSIQTIETTCQILFSTLKINYWSTFHLKLDKSKKTIFLTNKKKNIAVDMQQYFVRRSKKYKAGIVLQAISELITNQNRKYVINLSSSIVHRVYEEIMKCVLVCQGEKLLLLLQQEQQEQNQLGTSMQNDPISKALIILSPKNINQYLQQKQKILKQCLTHKFQFKQIYKSSYSQLTIEHSSKFPKIYKMENLIENYPKNLKEDFISALYRKNKFIISTEVLESFSKKYKAVYEKYLIHNKIQEMISIREENISGTQEEVLFMKTVENIMSINYIDYMYVRIRDVSPIKMKVIIFISVNNNSKKFNVGPEIVKRFLIELHEMVFREDQKEKEMNKFSKIEGQKVEKVQLSDELADIAEEEYSDEEDEFETVKGNSEQFLQLCEDGVDDLKIENEQGQIKIKELNESKLGKNLRFEKMEEMVEIESMRKGRPSSNFYLIKTYLTQPEAKIPLDSYQIMKEHYLFSQWSRGKSGGVICRNEAKITIQKNLFKIAITKYGKNLLKGEILKISLPIEIFRKQSHLQSIGRNLSYAPLFLQKLSNIDYEKRVIDSKMDIDSLKSFIALERVKYATLLAISVGTVGILMDKPFNPILGETIQLWIKGCPMYVEQISHHPPIGAYYFKGRGYTINGLIQPKMNFGMNHIKGFSPQPNYIKFFKHTQNQIENQEIQSEIEMSFGKMVIKGTLFGERQFNFEDKIYVFDKTNLIFSSIHYGPLKKSMITKNSQLSDCLFGHIYRLKPAFLEKFQNSKPRVFPKKQDIVQELSSFEGYWNDIIKFNGVQYVDFKTDLPHEVIHEKDPLPSNSSYRTDLQKLIEDDIQGAQKQKDRMQEAQRKDQRLREQYKKAY